LFGYFNHSIIHRQNAQQKIFIKKWIRTWKKKIPPGGKSWREVLFGKFGVEQFPKSLSATFWVATLVSPKEKVMSY
jgi:hypothetical protein